MNTARWLTFGLLVWVCVATPAQSYHFDIDPDRSYTDGYVQIRLWTSGSFRGDFDTERNPKGTRTKAGTEGEFAGVENGAVLAKPYFEFHNSSVLKSRGTFDLTVDAENGKAILNSYKVERLAAGRLLLNAQCALNNEPFRTDGPPAIFKPDLAAFGTGQAELNRLTITQRPGPRIGTAVDLGNGWYRVSVTFMADVQIDIINFDQEGPMTFTMAASLVGNFQKTSDGAYFGYPKGQGGDNLTREVDLPLEDFPVLLPAGVDPEGNRQKARVRLLANVGKVSLAINGIREMNAVGKPIPISFSGPVPPH